MPRKLGANSEEPPDLADLLKGLYEKVARQLDLNPYSVSRVARGEIASQTVEDALRRELVRIKSLLAKRRGARQGVARKRSASKKTKKTRARKKKSLPLLIGKPIRDPNR